MQSIQTVLPFGRPDYAGMATLSPISLIIRNTVAREGLRRILTDNGFEVISSVSHLGEMIPEDIQSSHIVIIDNVDALQQMSSKAPDARLVLLEQDFDFYEMNQAFAVGAHAYILQDVSFDSFVAMIHLVASGQKVAPTELIESLRDMHPAHHHHHNGNDIAKAYGLRGREIEILDCLKMGMPNKAISRKLGVSEATVKLAVKGTLRKMSVKNRTQAAILAQNGSDWLHDKHPAQAGTNALAARPGPNSS
jgi:two-component system nitrate/nitrite response regulator NarL